ncbi:hypothetical protein [Bdellovibrio sp. BCCA]|uniref:hypothetical protein n=1 Tax=Bdellovibrio sp. BCCA TaxID=3136281 RepID=UPI0030F0464B
MKKVISFFMIGSFAMLSSSMAEKPEKTPTPSPIKSKEAIDFLSKSDQTMLDIGKVDDFAGIITRTGESSKDLRTVDLYTFKGIENLSMDKELCEKLLARIFGPLKESSLKYHEAEIFTSHTGKTCEAQVDDPDKAGKIPERRVVLGFVNAKPVGLVFRLSKKSDKTVKNNIREFWGTLR